MNAALAAVVEKFPAPADDRKLAAPDKQKMDQAVAELLEMGAPGIAGLVAMLVDPGKGGDSRVRHALHALAVRAGTLPEEKRREVALAFAATLGGDRPKEAQGFVVRQLQVCGGREVAEPLAKLLGDEEISPYAAQALVAVGGTTAEFVRALGDAKGSSRLAIVASLAALGSDEARPALKKAALTDEEEPQVRQTARSGLARIGHLGDVAILLNALKSQGYERMQAVKDCLVFAERLAAVGEPQARRIYRHLADALDPSESHVREALRLGLAACDGERDQFRGLFDGKDLSTWQDPSGGPAPTGWLVKDGAMVLTDGAGDIWTKDRFGDFILSLEFKTTGNSGIFIRTDKPTDNVQTGIEIQVDNPSQKPGKHSCGAVYDCLAPSKNAAKKDAWNRIVITAQGSKINVVMNGEAIVDMDLDQWTAAGKNPDASKNKFRTALKDFKREGHIGFQDHGASVMYRNVRIKPLAKKD